MMTPCRQIMTSLTFFRLMANLEELGSCIPGAWSVKFTFLLIVTFYLTKTESRTEKSLKQLFWTKNADFFPKSADISKI